MAHLVPLGTPSILVPFIVGIELVRNIIRPITLAVRLAANITAGHLILTLIRRPLPSRGLFTSLVIFGGILPVIVLEIAVSLIQRYVFITLVCLYLREVRNDNL